MGIDRQALRDEGGVTLVELMVVVVLLGIVGGALFTSVLTVHDAADHVAYRSSDQGYARTGVAVLSRDIRVATKVPGSSTPAFRQAGPLALEFTAAIGSFERPQLVTIQADGSNQLVETAIPPEASSIAPDLTYPAGDAVVRYVARFLVAGQPSYFRFYDSNDNEIVPPTPGGLLTEAQRRAIARVQMEFTIREDPLNDERQTTVRTGVRLPNPIG